MDRVTILASISEEDFPRVAVTYDGTRISRFFADEYLRDIVYSAIKDSAFGRDNYDTANFIFSDINQSVRRHYNGQELMLESVELKVDKNFSITVSR